MEVNGIESDLDENEVKQLLKDFTTALDAEDATSMAIKDFVTDLDATREHQGIVPFSSARKWSGATFDGVSYVLGAPEFVFRNLDDDKKEKISAMAEQGYRVLVLAKAQSAFDGQNLPDGLELVAYVYITDKIRAEAPDTLRYFREQGVTVKIISGDNPATVRAVALRAGLEDCDNIIDMSTVTEDQIEDIVEKYTIFGRVLPDQKLALVKALKKHGHTVAMTGDGVNDVLALKEADCSVAMASGSDAAKNVSSLVLLDSNFASMPKVVEEGRRSINNLERSASLYLMKTLYNTMLAVLFMIVPFDLPFEPRHLTLISSVTIGIPSVVLALEPNKDRVSGHFLPKVLSHALPGSITVVLGAVAVIITNACFLKDLRLEQVQSLYLVLTTFVGLMYLFKVSMPFNWIHVLNFVAMIGIYVAFYFIDLGFFSTIEYFGLDKDFTMDMIYAILAIGAVLLVAFVGLLFATKGVNKKEDSNLVKLLKKANVI
jgi:cation-transporting ATPase E